MRSLRALLGLAMALLGLLLLLEQAGWVLSAVSRFYLPLLAAGGLLLLLVALGRRAMEEAAVSREADPQPRASLPAGEAVAITLAEALKAELTIRAPLGRLTVSAGEAGPDLLTGRFLAPVSANAHLSGATLHATLAPAADTPAARVDWAIALHPATPLKLQITTGSGDALLDCSRLDLLALDLTSGVGRCQIRLPAHEGELRLTLRSGTGGIQVHTVPDTAWQVTGVTDRLLVPPDFPTGPNGPTEAALPTAAPRRAVILHIAAATGAIRLLPPAPAADSAAAPLA